MTFHPNTYLLVLTVFLMQESCNQVVTLNDRSASSDRKANASNLSLGVEKTINLDAIVKSVTPNSSNDKYEKWISGHYYQVKIDSLDPAINITHFQLCISVNERAGLPCSEEYPLTSIPEALKPGNTVSITAMHDGRRPYLTHVESIVQSDAEPLDRSALLDTLYDNEDVSYITGILDSDAHGYVLRRGVVFPFHPQVASPNVTFYSRSGLHGSNVFLSVTNQTGTNLSLINGAYRLDVEKLVEIKNFHNQSATLKDLVGYRVRIKGKAKKHRRDASDGDIVARSILSLPSPALGGCILESPYFKTVGSGCEVTHPISGKKIIVTTYNQNLQMVRPIFRHDPSLPLQFGFQDVFVHSGRAQSSPLFRFQVNGVSGATSFAVPVNPNIENPISQTLLADGRIEEAPSRPIPNLVVQKLSKSCSFSGDQYAFLDTKDILSFGRYLDLARGVRRDNQFVTNIGGLATVENGDLIIAEFQAHSSPGLHIMCKVVGDKADNLVLGGFNHNFSAFEINGASGQQKSSEPVNANHIKISEFNSSNIQDSHQFGELNLYATDGTLSSSFTTDQTGPLKRMLGFFARRTTDPAGRDSLYFAGIAYRLLANCSTPDECQAYESIPSRKRPVTNPEKGFESGIVILKMTEGKWQTLAEEWFGEGPIVDVEAYYGHFPAFFKVNGKEKVNMEFQLKTYSGETFNLLASDSDSPLSAGKTGILGHGLQAQTYAGSGSDNHASFANYGVIEISKLTNFCANPDREKRFDVNGDGRVSSLDSLHIINGLNGRYKAGACNAPKGYYPDVNGDGRVTAGDSLQVINRISTQK